MARALSSHLNAEMRLGVGFAARIACVPRVLVRVVGDLQRHGRKPLLQFPVQARSPCAGVKTLCECQRRAGGTGGL